MLFVESIELENIGAFKGKKKFVFEKGTNVLSAENGSGKSTVLNMISFLLLNSYSDTLDSTLNNKSLSGSGKLIFWKDDEKYISTVSLKRTSLEKGKTSSEKKLYKTDESNCIAEGEDVAKKLNKIFPSFLTEYSLFCKQKGERITSMGDTDRRNLLAQLCELDYKKKVEEEYEPDISNIKTMISEKEKKEYALKTKTYMYQDEKKINFEWKDSDVEKIKELQEKQTLYESSMKDKEKLENLKIKLEDSKKELDKVNDDYNKDTLKLNFENNKKSIENDYNDSVSKLEKDYDSNIKSYNSKLETLQSNIDDWMKELSEIKLIKLAKFDDTVLNNARNDLSEFKLKSKIAFENADKLSKGVCPICGGECKGKHDEYYNIGCENEKKSVECESVISDLEQKKKNIEEKSKENEDNKKRKETLQNYIDNNNMQINLTKESIENCKSRFNKDKENLEKNYTEKLAMSEKSYNDKIVSANQLIESHKKIVDNLNEEISQIKIVDYADVSSELKELSDKKEIYDDVVSSNKIIKENNKKLKEIEKNDKIELETIQKDLIILQNKLADLNLAKEVMLKRFPIYALNQRLNSIASEINAFIEDVYYKALNISFVPNKTLLEMKYCGEEGGKDLPIVKTSGAEEKLVNLACQNVFNERQNLGCFIGDEIDAEFDDKVRESFFETLSNITSRYEQSIIITHSKMMKTKLVSEGANLIQF